MNGIEVAVVEVRPSNTPPVRYKGQIWVRVGPRRGVANSDDERVLNERRRSLGAYVQFLRIDGTDLSDPVIDEKRLDGALSTVLRQLDEMLTLNIKSAVDFTSSHTELRRPDYPLSALQQIARNAVMHRSYENTNSPTRVTWYRDRVEVVSPGGLFGVVAQAGIERGMTDYRNPTLAEMIRGLGYVQRFGAGIPITRSALSTDHVVIPLAPDLFSLQGLRNLGPTLREWRKGWMRRLDDAPDGLDGLPQGTMNPAGYVLLQHGVRLNKPVKAYDKWISRIPGEFHRSILGQGDTPLTVKDDPSCLGLLKNYHSLVPLAQDARKPIFALTHADGAFGGHLTAARESYTDFKALALRVIDAAAR